MATKLEGKGKGKLKKFTTYGGESKAKAEEWAGCGIVIFFFFRVSQADFLIELSFSAFPLQERDVGEARPITPSCLFQSAEMT